MRFLQPLIAVGALFVGSTLAAQDELIRPPQLADDLVTVELGSKAAKTCTGGTGRYLIFHLKEEKKLAIFDASAARVVKEIAAPDDGVLIAASFEKLMVLLPGQKLMQRWDLETLEREKTVPLTNPEPPLQAVMGCNSDGPLAIWFGKELVFCDIDKLRPIPVQGKPLSGSREYGFGLRVSADGQTFMGWTTGISGQRFNAMRLVGNACITKSTPDSFSYNGRWALPNTDASFFFRFGGGVYSADLQPLAAKNSTVPC